MSFITDEMVIDILKLENDGTNFELINCELEIGTTRPINGYCSEASRYVINYKKNGERKTKSVFLKIPYKVPFVREKGVYKKELYMYRTVLSSYSSLLPDDPVAPVCYSSDKKDAIVLEDITEVGYRMYDKNIRLDFQHCCIALKALAKFHAFSAKLNQTNPKMLDELRKESIFNSAFLSNKERVSFYENNFSKMVNRTHFEYVKSHSDTVEFVKNNLVRSAIYLLRPNEHSFNVLNHGDFWTDNIMFKYDSFGSVAKAKLVDFQCCRWSSPAIDILYFAINSMKFEVFEKYFDLLLELYTDTLNAVMSYLKCDQILKIDDLRKEVERKYIYGILVLVGITPTMMGNRDEEVAGGFEEKLLDAEQYVDLSTKWFSYFIQKGVFSKYHDTVNAIGTFLKSFQEESNGTVTKYDFDENIIKAGTNFSSVITRLKFEYEKDGRKLQKSVLLKIPSLCTNYEHIGKSGIYDREIYAYKILLPEMYEMWDGAIFSPAVYSITEAKVLVMEDLNEAGYALRDKKVQLDLDHCKVVLRTLAQYHALSLKYLQTNPEHYVELSAKDSGTESLLAGITFSLLNRFLEAISPLISEKLFDKLRLHAEPSNSKLDIFFLPRDDGLNVILHGDVWINNFLFKYDDKGNACLAKFVDWQLCRKGSPALELIYLLVSSLPFKLYEKYHDFLFDFYLDIFNETLLRLKCDCKYTRSQLDEDIKKHKFIFVMTIAITLQVIMLDQTDFMNYSTTSERLTSYTTVVKDWLFFLDAKNLL